MPRAAIARAARRSRCAVRHVGSSNPQLTKLNRPGPAPFTGARACDAPMAHSPRASRANVVSTVGRLAPTKSTRTVLRAALVGLVLTAVVSPAFAGRRSGAGVPGCDSADRDSLGHHRHVLQRRLPAPRARSRWRRRTGHADHPGGSARTGPISPPRSPAIRSRRPRIGRCVTQPQATRRDRLA